LDVETQAFDLVLTKARRCLGAGRISFPEMGYTVKLENWNGPAEEFPFTR